MSDELQAKRARLEDAVRKAHADLAEAEIQRAGLYGQRGDTIGRMDELADFAAVERTAADARRSLDQLRKFLEGYHVDE
jgi:hypothetical protein